MAGDVASAAVCVTCEPSSTILSALLLCGLMGVIGQGARAAVGLKNARVLNQNVPTQQSEFSAFYFILSLLIGFIAGVVAGLIVGIHNFIKIDTDNMKLLLGIIVSGYAGADFIENSLSIFIPPAGSVLGKTGTSSEAPPTSPADLATLTTKIDKINASMASLNAVVVGQSPVVAPQQAEEASALTHALKIASPRLNTDVWGPALIAAFKKFDVNNNRRIAAAVGQFLVEAGSRFQELKENLNYTSPERIIEIFRSHFKDEQEAAAYVNDPAKLANKVYSNRNGNGDEASGDGYRFRGRGLIQLTGREEYTEFGATLGMTAEQAADYCETIEGSAKSGCWYLSSHGCLPLADSWRISAITLKVNGEKMVGAGERAAYAHSMLKALGDSVSLVA